MIGAVISWFVIDRIDFGTLPDPVAFILILIGVFMLTGLLGVALERIAIAPLRVRKAGFLPPLISTIAVSLILVSIADAVFGEQNAFEGKHVILSIRRVFSGGKNKTSRLGPFLPRPRCVRPGGK